MNLILTTLNGELIITDENKRYKAKHERMEKALTYKTTLQEAVNGDNGLLEDWTPITHEESEYGWGNVLDTAVGEVVIADGEKNNRISFYRYAENYVQAQIRRYESDCLNSSPGSGEHKKALDYVLYWQDQYILLAKDEREEMRRVR